MTIRILPPDVAARIAAGEVVERPASVVRELLDNAIDAGASRIALEIDGGGIDLIRITDDGCGMPPGDVELAFERHATSKIGGLDDLGNVRTLGFRGEALPSIAAAADVEVTTRVASEPVGIHLVLVDGVPVRRAARPAPAGTTIAVRDLFARLPARRKFLGSAASETRQVAALVAHYALAYPRVAFSFTNTGRRVLATSGDGDIRHAFGAVYGAANAAEMLEVAFEEAGVRVEGLAGPPSLHRGNRSAVSVFVNGRWVQSRSLLFAVTEAYQSQLPGGRFPYAAISIALPPEEVDVNVHPAKAEVRFRDERAVGRAVRHAVLHALDRAAAQAWSVFGPVAIDEDEPLFPGPPPAVSARSLWPLRPVPRPAQVARALEAPAPLQARLGLDAPRPESAPAAQRDLLPLLRVVGQLGATYIVCEGPDGMYLLDQHAAHERVTYDRLVLRRAAAEPPALQPLLEPVLLELDLPAAATLEEHREHLTALGLEVEPFGETAYLLRSVPAGLESSDVTDAIRRLLDQLGSDRRVTDPFARAAATVACHASVRAGMALAMDEMRRLVEDLERTTSPRTCPHGRPTLVHVSRELLERQFGRR